MKLNNLDFIRLLPQFMRDDTAVQGLAAGLNAIIPSLSESVKTLSTWDHIDDLSEAELDELAWELNILWYDLDASIAVKRDLVRNSDKVWQYIGTKWAVENVVATYFGDGKIEEWFEYGGQPGRFRVHSNNPDISRNLLEEFLNVLNKVKRASAKLDGIFLAHVGEFLVSAGVVFHEVCTEEYSIGVAQTAANLADISIGYVPLGEDEPLTTSDGLVFNCCNSLEEIV